MRKASERRIEEFEGPREVSAKEAYVAGSAKSFKAWAGDAGLLRITSNMISAPYLSSFPVVLPVTNGKGRLGEERRMVDAIPFANEARKSLCDRSLPWAGDADKAWMRLRGGIGLAM